MPRPKRRAAARTNAAHPSPPETRTISLDQLRTALDAAAREAEKQQTELVPGAGSPHVDMSTWSCTDESGFTRTLLPGEIFDDVIAIAETRAADAKSNRDRREILRVRGLKGVETNKKNADARAVCDREDVVACLAKHPDLTRPREIAVRVLEQRAEIRVLPERVWRPQEEGNKIKARAKRLAPIIKEIFTKRKKAATTPTVK